MQSNVSEIELAHKIDTLEEAKNKLIKCHHRLEECRVLHKQYEELRRHWNSRDKRYQYYKGEYYKLIQLNKKLEAEKVSLQNRLRREMAKLSSTANSLGSLQRRYTLLKTACKRYIPPEELPPSPLSIRRRTSTPPPSPRPIRKRTSTPQPSSKKQSYIDWLRGGLGSPRQMRRSPTMSNLKYLH